MWKTYRFVLVLACVGSCSGGMAVYLRGYVECAERDVPAWERRHVVCLVLTHWVGVIDCQISLC